MKLLNKLALIIIIFVICLTNVKANTTGTITADDGLYVRRTVNGAIATGLSYGTTVTVTGTNEGSTSNCSVWYKITYGNYNDTGYVCGDYVNLLKGYASCVENNDPVNVWSDTNKSSKKAQVACDKEMTILDKDISSNNKCSNNWYKVSYNGTVGYSCSTYVYTSKNNSSSSGGTSSSTTVSTSYNRPWTTPKKSIVGGAIFVAENYISKGQYTSYLKKFNVNPNSSSSLYNHQYMANLAAPSSEAKTSYNSYSSNGLLSLPLNFVIPVFNNMPDTTALPGKSADTSGQNNVTDNYFEQQLNAQGFPETYKKKLRVLHNNYPNWTFEAMQTGLDFNRSVTAEQAVSSINLGYDYYKKDANGNTISTEPGWYLANTETVAYYLDPRNFLNVTGILQFESLKNSSNYTENVVQSILNNTHMSGYSTCDNNQSYASIFVEAGSKADVSPVYLASLARQETGVDGSITTTGQKFTYKGVTYKWLYNYYNIGASSSEESPARAGLVYASGGDTSVITTENDTDNSVCPQTSSNDNNSNNNSSNNNNQNNNSQNQNSNNSSSNQTPTVTNKGSNYYLNHLGASIKDGNYISGFSVDTTAGTIKNKMSDSKRVDILNSNNYGLGNNDKIKTGDKIIITDLDGTTRYSYNVIIYGDVNGDGNISAGDYVTIKNYILGKNELNGASLKAADINRTNSITASDYVMIKNAILGKSTISQS